MPVLTTTAHSTAQTRLKAIQDFAAKNHSTDPAKVSEMLAEAIEIAREIGDVQTLQLSLWRRGIGLRTLLKGDEAVQNLLEALELAETHGTKREVAGILETLGLTYYTFNMHDEALDSHQLSAEIFGEIGAYREQAKELSDVAAVLFKEGNLSNALEICKKAFAICRLYDVEPPLQLYHTNALIYGEVGEFNRALEYHLIALKEAEEIGNLAFQASLHSSIAAIYEKNGDLELAYEYHTKVMELHKRFHHPSTKIFALINSIDLLLLLGKLDEAEQNIAESYRLVEQYDYKERKHFVFYVDGILQKTKGDFLKAHELFDCAFNLWEDAKEPRLRMKIYLEKARISENEEREKLLLKALHDSLILESKDVLPDIYLALSEYYESVGDTASALKYHKMYHDLQNELQGEKSRRHYQVIQIEHEAERKAKEAEILRLENEKLAQKLEHGKDQLTTLASYLTQKNQVLSAIQKTATDALKAKGSMQKSLLRNILKLSAESSETFWEQFENRFKTVYGDFPQRLVRRHPDLTPMELRVCILTRAGLPNKETGDLLSISGRTVESHRSSIRKKFGLDRNANLTSYLALL
jgi:DNA-binding CsgD family transcriptional regulator/tetratricopeptide (TPR) repeat protein